MTTNPYAAPKAAVADETAVLNADFVPGGQSCPAGNGWTWIADGWGLFKRQPGVWIGIVVLTFVIFVAVSFIPVAGPLAVTLFGPVFAAGFMVGCRTLDTGGGLEVGHLFAGFRSHTATLIAVGGLYLAAYLVILLAVSQATGVGLLMLMGAADAEALAQIGLATYLLAVLLVLALILPAVMAIWLAAPLVVFHEHGAVEAMKGSFTGCLKNILPFLVYSVVLFLFMIVATLPLMLGWLVLGPVFAASVYASYRDIYLKPRQ